MKKLIFILALLPLTAFAEKVDLKDVDTDSDDTTTIEISKNKKNKKEDKKDNAMEVVEGTADIEGEMKIMKSEAEASWNQAFKEWEKTFRKDNKDAGNIVLVVTKGKMNCVPEDAGKRCSSTATYKMKTKVN